MTERWYTRSNKMIEFLQSWEELSTNYDPSGFLEWVQTAITDALKQATDEYFIITLPEGAPTTCALAIEYWLHEEMHWRVVTRKVDSRLRLYLGVNPQIAHDIAFPARNRS